MSGMWWALTFLPVGFPGTSLVLVAARQPKGIQRAYCVVDGLHHGDIRAMTYSNRPRPVNSMSSKPKRSTR